MDPHVAAALEQLRAALTRNGERRPLFVEVLYSDGTADRLAIPAERGRTNPATASGQVSPATDNERLILEVLSRAEKPLKGRTVASRAGLAYNSHLRQTLSVMRRAGRIQRAPSGGYWPANKPLPPDTDD